MRLMTKPGWTPSVSERLRANEAIRKGVCKAYCSKCQKGGLYNRKGPEKCTRCAHATQRLKEIVEWIQEHEKPE